MNNTLPCTITQTWAEFYENRVNSSYQDYFETKYVRMISLILSYLGDTSKIVREEGIGIGSLSKALGKHNIQSYGFDLSPEMVELAKENNSENRLFGGAYRDDILNPIYLGSRRPVDLIVTHGVLEHFSDHEIHSMCMRYFHSEIPSIHYVPTNKYKEPSFGDERLLPVDKWLSLTQPRHWELTNDNYDLLLVI